MLHRTSASARICFEGRSAGKKYVGVKELKGETDLFGVKYKYVFQICGQGVLKLFLRLPEGKKRQFAARIPLTEKWQDLSVSFVSLLPETDRTLLLEYVLEGEKDHFRLANDRFVRLSPAGGGIRSSAPFLMTVPGKEFRLHFSAPGLERVQFFDGLREKEKKISGTLEIAVKAPAEGIRTGLRDTGSGRFAYTYIHPVPAERWKEFEDVSGSISLKRPLRILFFGDELSDTRRNRNYIDMFSFWLNRCAPGRGHCINAALPGETIRLLHDSLTGKGFTFQRKALRRLPAGAVDVIFIFLGRNDTRCYYGRDRIAQTVPPERLPHLWQETLRFLKKHTGARIVLMTPAPLVPSPANQALPRFVYGEPGRLEQYAEILKKTAAAEQVEILDLYSLMKKEKEVRSFFVPGKMIFSPRGEEFTALQILRFMAGEKQ